MPIRTENLYFIFAALGLVATWYFNIEYFASGGSILPSGFFGSAFANPLTSSITVDVYWSAAVFSFWIIGERKRTASPAPWLYIALSFGVGLAFAFPLYLARREQLMRGQTSHAAPDKSPTPTQLRGSA